MSECKWSTQKKRRKWGGKWTLVWSGPAGEENWPTCRIYIPVLMEDDFWWGWQPLIKDNDLWRRMKTFDEGWHPLLKDDHLWWRMTFDVGWRTSKKDDNLWWKTTFDWRQSLVEDDLWWMLTFDGRWPMRRMTFDGRQPMIKRRRLMEVGCRLLELTGI